MSVPTSYPGAVYPALALILLGLAAFTVLVVRRPPVVDVSQTGRWTVADREQIRGFVYVGAAALALLALAVVVVGLFRPAGSGEVLAVVGLFAYVAYVAAAFAVGWWQVRARPRRAMDEPSRAPVPADQA